MEGREKQKGERVKQSFKQKVRHHRMSSLVEFQSPAGKRYSEEQAIELMVSLVATDQNSQKKCRGFYKSLTLNQLKVEWEHYW